MDGLWLGVTTRWRTVFKVHTIRKIEDHCSEWTLALEKLLYTAIPRVGALCCILGHCHLHLLWELGYYSVQRDFKTLSWLWCLVLLYCPFSSNCPSKIFFFGYSPPLEFLLFQICSRKPQYKSYQQMAWPTPWPLVYDNGYLVVFPMPEVLICTTQKHVPPPHSS